MSNAKYTWKPNEVSHPTRHKFKAAPKGIIIHSMLETLGGKPAPQFLSEDLGLSAHAFIDSHGIVENGQSIDRVGYHAGLSAYEGLGKYLNKNTLGIELLVPIEILGPGNAYEEFLEAIKTPWVTEQALNSLVETCRNWMKQYPSIEKKYILRHSDISGEGLRGKDAKKDPGEGFPWEEFKTLLKEELS